MDKPIDFDTTRNGFNSGEIFTWPNANLERASRGLATTPIINDNIKHQAIIMADAIHTILLNRLLDGQEERNKKTQFWFMVVACAALISSIAQIVVAIVK
ncbi:MAG: hypothetical protein P4L44_03165 [Oryzomonas sp.]|uniref:hypothetical protein n=1 Tax=Oryzomonas sp. TaxID=2855186 RepID=UPI00284A3D37|nr:hypothetical protein [Oryzomonas sp.]MDR3578945.1 hypothetical protein [Oryzomonas sp.]